LFGDVEPLLQSLKIIRTEPGAADRPATIDVAEVQRLLESSNRLADRSVSLLQELHTLSGEGKGLMSGLGSPVDRTLRRWLIYLVLLGGLWAAFFWSGYYIAKRAVAHDQSARSTTPERDDKK
jgi:hypothetical protein